MRTYEARVEEIRIQDNGAAAWIACPSGAIPTPGRYVLAWAVEDTDASLATPLFAGETGPTGFLAVSPLPAGWEPGAQLSLRGPLGRGFDLPAVSRRLALAALGDTAGRLLPLIHQALAGEVSVALFTNCRLPSLPSAVEIYPLSTLPEALEWADFLALDLPVDVIPALGQALGLQPGAERLSCPAQALVLAPMPCGGLADCGACGLLTRRGWKLACKDGPVFEASDLL